MSTASIPDFFERYAARYMAFDAAAVAAMYEAPFLAVRQGRVIHLPDREAVQAHLQDLMAAYRDAGAAQATIADLRVMDLDGTSALATVRWHALGSDGALIRDFTTTYQLLRVGQDAADGDWRVLSYTYHDAP